MLYETWYVEEFSYVEKGAKIYQSDSGKCEYAYESGYFVCRRDGQGYPGERCPINVGGYHSTYRYGRDYFYPLGYKIVESIDEYVHDQFIPSKPKIQIDEFSGKPTITWSKLRKTFYKLDETPCLRIKDYFGFMLECIDGATMITFTTIDNKSLPFKKKDVVSFLFEDSSVISFEFKKISKLKKISTTKCCLYQEDLDLLTNKKVKTIKVTFDDERTPDVYVLNRLLGGEALPKAILMHASEFKELLNRNEVVPPKRDTEITDVISTAESCYVYLMLDTANDLYKIGISKSAQYREKTLQSEKPSILHICSKEYPHRIIAAAIEKALHEAFDRKRVRGEWFNLSPDEVNMIIKTLT